jgi:hypothetical protein
LRLVDRQRSALFVGFPANMAESDFPHPYVTGYGSSPSRCEPGLFVATGQAWDLPVPAQRACAHARFFDHAGPSGHSRCRARTYCLPPSQRRRRPGYESLRGSMAGLCTPLPTLRRRPYGLRRTAWGRYGSLLLHRIGLAPTARCRSPGALRKILDTTDALPASPATVAAFLAHEAGRNVKASTIGRRTAAIRYAHKLAGLATPTDDEMVKATVRGIRRTLGTAKIKKASATAERLLAMSRTVAPASRASVTAHCY